MPQKRQIPLGPSLLESFANRIHPLNVCFFGRTPANMLGICTGRELQRPNSDTFRYAFSLFCIFVTRLKHHENPYFSKTLQIKASWDHAHMIERKKLYNVAERTSVRANPTLDFFSHKLSLMGSLFHPGEHNIFPVGKIVRGPEKAANVLTNQLTDVAGTLFSVNGHFLKIN